MLDLTIHNIDATLERDLRGQARRNDRSIEEEAMSVLKDGIATPSTRRIAELAPDEVAARKRLILSYGRKPLEPFDLKACSDALFDGSE